MKQCPYCGHSNYDNATECRKCEAPFIQQQRAESKRLIFGPQKARRVRGKALAGLVLGLLMKVYWGGYGPWPIIDNPTAAGIRSWLEPLLLYGGGVLYLVGWVLNWI